MLRFQVLQMASRLGKYPKAGTYSTYTLYCGLAGIEPARDRREWQAAQVPPQALSSFLPSPLFFFWRSHQLPDHCASIIINLPACLSVCSHPGGPRFGHRVAAEYSTPPGPTLEANKTLDRCRCSLPCPMGGPADETPQCLSRLEWPQRTSPIFHGNSAVQRRLFLSLQPNGNLFTAERL